MWEKLVGKERKPGCSLLRIGFHNQSAVIQLLNIIKHICRDILEVIQKTLQITQISTLNASN
ncbi:hypothetical protein CW304_19595 [Bacillus sp. UFRGS-B20]|nr:hypothetical protein CW304_19595 [Bacillus sp. UFRGS-B20]